MQTEIKSEKNVIESGIVKNPGWSRQPVFYFDKALCKNRFQLLEEDSYVILNNEVTIHLTVFEDGIVSGVSALIINHQNGKIEHRTLKNYMSFGRLNMPTSSKMGDTTYTDVRVGMNFSNTALNRYIRCDFVDFYKDKNLYINLELKETLDESFNVLLPEKEGERGFWLERFLPGMKVSGVVRLGGEEYRFTPEESFAFLRWQRSYLKGKACYHGLYSDALVEGNQFSLHLAGGIGDVSRGGGNCYFYKGEVHKLASIKADGSEEKPHKTWHFTAGNGALDLKFKPTIKGGHLLSAKLGKKTCVLGKLYGTINQMNAEKITLDAVPAHLEFSII